MNNRPIGIFDSGVGGLTVVREIQKLLPKEKIVYFGDTARVPYGTKSKKTIQRFSIENTKFLLKFKIKLLVIACNSSSSTSLGLLKSRFKIPIIGVIQPGAEEALKKTHNSRIGVIGTTATILSGAYEREIKKGNAHVKVVSRACPLFVPLAEEGWVEDKVTRAVADRYLRPLLKLKIDTLILGCTHYPLLKKIIRSVVGKKVNLIDSAASVAKEVDTLLKKRRLKTTSSNHRRYRFYVSDEPERFMKLGKRFLGQRIEHIQKVNNV